LDQKEVDDIATELKKGLAGGAQEPKQASPTEAEMPLHDLAGDEITIDKDGVIHGSKSTDSGS